MLTGTVWKDTVWKDVWKPIWAAPTGAAVPGWKGEVNYIEELGGGVVFRLYKNLGDNQNVSTVVGTYTVLGSDYTVVCNRGTAFTVTLPTGIEGQILNIKNIGAGTVTVSLAGDTIDGSASQSVYQWDNMKLQCYAANSWVIL